MNISNEQNKLEEQFNVHISEAQEQIARQNQTILEYQAQLEELQNDTPYEELHKKRGFFLSSLSIDETRLSALILCLLACMLFGGVSYVLVGDITANLTNIITALIYSIAGVNITNSVLNKFGNNNSEITTQVQMNNTIRPIGNSSNQPTNQFNQNCNQNNLRTNSSVPNATKPQPYVRGQ